MALFAKEKSARKSDHSLSLGSFLMADADELLQPVLSTAKILACSSSEDSRPLCADRKGFFDHLYPMTLLKSTIRITATQASTTVTQYLNEQFKAHIETEDLVKRGKMTPAAAETEADEWSEREWNKRINAFPNKLTVALLKYHSIMLVMRFYELMVSRYSDNVTLDKLTIDTFDAAKRSADQGKAGRELAMEVYHTNLRANLISYLADYTVHQVILCFGYYAYIQYQRKERKRKMEEQRDSMDEDEGVITGSLVLSMVKKSALLAFSRVLGLFFSSLGSALGSMVVPSWGSLAGATLGDTLAMNISDDFMGPATP